MRMRNPAHPGAIIRDSMNETGLTPRELAEKLGVERETLTEFLDERAGISPTLALAIERVGWGRADLLMRIQEAHDESQALLREKAAKAAPAPPQKVGAA